MVAARREDDCFEIVLVILERSPLVPSMGRPLVGLTSLTLDSTFSLKVTWGFRRARPLGPYALKDTKRKV